MVRRSSSRFRPEVSTTVPNTGTNEDVEGNNNNNNNYMNDGASDIGSDIMTISDIHTITNENDIAMMHQQQHHRTILNQQNIDLLTGTPIPYANNPDVAAGGIGNHNMYSPSDIRTIDNDNASIISDLQHTVGTFGAANDDINTVTGTVTGSVLHLKSPGGTTDNNHNAFGSTMILGISDNDLHKSTTTAAAQSESAADTSFWARAIRTLGITQFIPKVATQNTVELDEYYDEGRPLPYPNTPGEFNKNDNDGPTSAISTPPPAVIVTTRNTSTGNNNPYTPVQGMSSGDSFTNTMTAAPTTSVWKQRLCGLRADRLILLLMFILLAAVGVIVGAIVVSQSDNTKSSSASASNAENDRPVIEDGMITLTRTPTTAGPAVFIPTAAPIVNMTAQICDNNITAVDDMKVTFPVSMDPTLNDGTVEYNGCEWVSSQSDEVLNTLCQIDSAAYELCRLTCRNCEELPMNKKKAWPIEVCGGDSPDRSFDAGADQGMGNCYWLSRSPFDVARLCQPNNAAYELCRETCRNCGPVVNVPIPSDAPTIAPSIPNVTSEVPSSSPSETPISLTLAPSIQNVTATTVSPATISPTIPPVVTTLAPITVAPTSEAPITAAPVTEAPVSPLETLAGVIISASPQSSERLATAGSSQSQALEWLRLALDTGIFDATTISDARTVQIWTLATFAFSLGLNELWLNSGGNDECLWDGIVCSADTRTVVGMDLAERSLTGTLPPELALLSGMIGLNLSSNGISGRLPNNFGSTFQQLEDLRFDRNEFSGTLPATIGQMSSLRIWYMERNPSITGTLPSTIVQLSNLEEFIFYYTDITGVIPQGICDLPNLNDLRLDCIKTSFDGDECWTRCLFLCGGDSGVPCQN